MKGKQKMKTTTEATRTQQVIFDMLTTNTGTDCMDSGGDDGRHWQRNAKKTLDDFMSEPWATIDPKWGHAAISLFHYMSEYLVFDEGLTNDFETIASNYPDEGWLNIIEQFLDALEVADEGEFYSDARWSFNTYNFENWSVNQTLQGSFFGLGKKTYLIVQVHGGADVRGGYTAPKVFQLKGFYDKDDFVLSAGDISFTCPNCESSLRLEGYSAMFINADGEGVDIEATEMPVCKCGGEWVA
jgi:hypothetical protein